jgi:hypothetical protein
MSDLPGASPVAAIEASAMPQIERRFYLKNRVEKVWGTFRSVILKAKRQSTRLPCPSQCFSPSGDVT